MVMDKIKSFLGRTSADEAVAAISKELPLADCTLDDCDDGSCTLKYPSSVKIETDAPLWGTASAWKLQVLVATTTTDWPHDATDDPSVGGRVAKALSKGSSILEKKVDGPVKIQTTTWDVPHDVYESGRTAVVLLPHFRVIEYASSETVLDDVLRSLDDDDLGGRMRHCKNRAYLLLCSHRTRDKRCGVTAPIMKQALENELRLLDLHRDPGDNRPGGVTVLYVNHVGGHKFAANLFVYLDSGESIWMARLGPRHAKGVVDKTVMEGKVFPDHVRACFKVDW